MEKSVSSDIGVTLVHTSDLHVDEALGPGPYDGLAGLQAVIAAAAAIGAHGILLAGDTFDNARVPAPILQRTAEVLAACHCEVAILPGNHDPFVEAGLFHRSGIAEIPHVHLIGLAATPRVRLAVRDIEIVGRAHTGFADMHPLPPLPPRAARWRVVMAHGHYVPEYELAAQAHRSWKFHDADLDATDADYIALGHWDRAVQVGQRAYYSGAPDLARTVNVVRLADEGVTVRRETLALPD